MTGTLPLSLHISEAEFVDKIIETAHLFHCRVAHFRPAKTERGWRTAMQGDVGYPDLSISRDGWVIIAEAKRHGQHPTPGQREWLAVLGSHGRLWYPSMFPQIVAELRDGPNVRY